MSLDASYNKEHNNIFKGWVYKWFLRYYKLSYTGGEDEDLLVERKIQCEDCAA